MKIIKVGPEAVQAVIVFISPRLALAQTSVRTTESQS